MKSSSRKYEIIGLLLMTLGILVLLCLVSANSDDPTPTGRNVIGVVGDRIATTLFRYLGATTAYTLTFSLLLTGARIFRLRKGRPITGVLAGALVVVAASSAISSVVRYPQSGGGLLGSAIGRSLIDLLGRTGAGIVLATLLFIGLLMMTNISYLRFYRRARSLAKESRRRRNAQSRDRSDERDDLEES